MTEYLDFEKRICYTISRKLRKFMTNFRLETAYVYQTRKLSEQIDCQKG